MDHVSENLIYVNERRLPYETFDADHHLYETQDALTKFLPPEYEGAVILRLGGDQQLPGRAVKGSVASVDSESD